LQEEKKRLKQEQKEAKKRAKEIARQEEALGADEGGNGLVTFMATILIIFLWIAVICVIVKLDVGGFGSSVLTPILKNVPVVNKILPRTSETETTDPDSYGGYSNLQEASDAVKQLELEVDRLQTVCDSREEEIENLKAENERLEQFEAKQVEFQRIQNEFYEEVVYAENGPGAEEFKKWYEEMDPTTAEYLYRQVVTQLEESEEIQDYANVYSEMKPKQAAAIFEEMTDDLNLVAKILSAMTAEERADILGVMDSEVAAKLTKIMNPDS
jgi:flagellar motility protein MotE (MotC chaperone)